MGISNLKFQISNFTNKGFTLIELLIVMAVMGTMVTGLVVTVDPLSQFEKARDAQRKSDLKQVQSALEAYYNDHGKYPCFDGTVCAATGWETFGQSNKLDYLVTNKYLKSIVTDPKAGSSCADPNTLGYLYLVKNGGQAYTLFAKLENTADPSATQNKPGTQFASCLNGCVTQTIPNGSCQNRTYNYWIVNP